MSVGEKEILKKIQLGDEEGLRQLFDLYYNSLCVYALKYIDSFDKAEDIVQEVFIKFWENKRADNISESLRNYLLKAVKNNALYYLRQSNRYQHEAITELLDQEAEFDEESADLEDKKKLLYAEIAKLSPQAKAVFEGIIFENLRYKEVAEELGVSVNTVKTTFARSLKRLRNSINLIISIMP